jgi:lipoate-protein ligase A
MHLLDSTLPGAAENLALDEALLLHAEQGGPEVLRFWEWPTPAVVLGAGGRLADDVNEPACLSDGVPILRRASGGGTVLLGSGCLLYSLILAYDRAPPLAEITPSYCYIFDVLQAALAPLVPGLHCAGTSDLAVNGRKVSGNSQQRKRRHLLHHGSLLYAFDLGLVGRYLRPPSRQPAYRKGRDHREFLTNLKAGAEELKRALSEAWGANIVLHAWPQELVKQLAADKYTRPEWIRRR